MVPLLYSSRDEELQHRLYDPKSLKLYLALYKRKFWNPCLELKANRDAKVTVDNWMHLEGKQTRSVDECKG